MATSYYGIIFNCLHKLHPYWVKFNNFFQFKEHIIDESQNLLHSASRGMKNITYVGVHVRRTDYIGYLKRKFNATPVKPNYFLRQMNVFRNKYKPIMFVVVSDDTKWCERELRGDDFVVIKTNSPAHDLAIMLACNHSIIDYGTYGMWGGYIIRRGYICVQLNQWWCCCISFIVTKLVYFNVAG